MSLAGVVVNLDEYRRERERRAAAKSETETSQGEDARRGAESGVRLQSLGAGRSTGSLGLALGERRAAHQRRMLAHLLDVARRTGRRVPARAGADAGARAAFQERLSLWPS